MLKWHTIMSNIMSYLECPWKRESTTLRWQSCINTRRSSTTLSPGVNWTTCASTPARQRMHFRRKAPQTAPVNIQGLDITFVEEYKYLGVHINNKLDWTRNTDVLYSLGLSSGLHWGGGWEKDVSQADINHGQPLSPPTSDCGGFKQLLQQQTASPTV